MGLLKRYALFVKNRLMTLLVTIENIALKSVITKAQQGENDLKTKELKFVHGVVIKLFALRQIFTQTIKIIFARTLVLLNGGLNLGFMEQIIQVGWVDTVKKHIGIIGVR